MLELFIKYLASKPVILDFLRRVLEANHRGEKRVIKEEFPDRLSCAVLDVGSGTGVFSPLFGLGYVGVDIDETYVQYARKKYQRVFLAADARKLPFPDASFDAIWVNGVLHHFDDALARAALFEMRRVLKENGRAVIMEDVPARALIPRLVRSLDLGDYIRTPEAYLSLIREHFTVLKAYPVRTGVCDYEVFVVAG